MRKNLVRSLGAYTLAAGAAALATNATTSQAALIRYQQPYPGAWYDATNDIDQDILMFKMDGTVVLNTANTGLQSLGQDADSFTFAEEKFPWYDTDGYDSVTLNVRANVGYVAGSDVWPVGKLDAGYEVGPALADGRVWADSTSAYNGTGGLGGWAFYQYGEWPFGGIGYIGLYADDVAGRHYGWAHINMTAYYAVELYEFAFESDPDTPTIAPEP
ncbi:unnamed protein product, partial [marine sediment metagenome]